MEAVVICVYTALAYILVVGLFLWILGGFG